MNISKPCIRCGAVKPLTDFHKHLNARDGHINKCRVCTIAEARKRQLERGEEYRSKVRAYHARPESKTRAKKREQMNPEARRRQVAKYKKNNPEKVIAHNAVNNSIRDGRMTRQSCEVCNAPNAQAHHEDYSKPLSVSWLCKAHHSEQHRLIKCA